jgi:type IV fimbrial biogenesis protein FimT
MRRHTSQGFTLVEALVVIALTAILVSMAIPEFRNFSARRGVVAQVSELASTIRLARTEAIKRGLPITVCRNSAAEGATPVCAGDAAGQGWATGWVMFVDRGVRGTIDAADLVLKVQPPFTNSGGIVTPDGSAYALTFEPNGVAVGAAQRLIFSPAIPSGDTAYSALQKTVCISFNGSTRLVDGSSTCT